MHRSRQNALILAQRMFLLLRIVLILFTFKTLKTPKTLNPIQRHFLFCPPQWAIHVIAL